MNFHRSFSRLSLRWRAGLCAAGLLAALALVLVVFIAAGLFDFVAPFDDAVRPVVTGALGSVCAGIVILALLPAMQLRAREIAASADAHAGPRRPVTSALELGATPPADASTVRAYLVRRSLEAGARALEQLAFPNNLPWRRIRTRALQLCGVLALIAVLGLAGRGAVGTVARRLLHPGLDIPPWSPLVFEVTPRKPQVIYGSDAEVEVTIKGGSVHEGVVMLTRAAPGAPVTEAGAFAMGGGRFGQKLQRVIQPIEIAFAAGRARSPWIQVEVLRQPRFESVILRITPPAYTGLPPKDIVPGTGDLVAVAGSRVEAHITSNRPLGGGTVTLTPPRGSGREARDSIDVRGTGERSLALHWQVKSPALVRIDLRDIAGAPSAQPVEFEQKLLPDQPPEVVLESPPAVVLATPESTVPLKLDVGDDFGIARVDLVRKLVGFRDRGRTLSEDAGSRTFALEETLDLAPLGVEPGQMLEIQGQAHDHNPSLMGIGSSRVGHIQVISHGEFGELVRARTTLEEFLRRFTALERAVESVRERLAAAAEGDPLRVAEALESMQKVQELAEAMSRDFIAFDAEQQVAEEAAKVAALMRGMRIELAQAGPARARAEVPRMLAELGGAERSTGRIAQDGREMAAVGRVLEMAAEFRGMHAEQRTLTKALEELSREITAGDMRNAARLDGLADRQQQVLERWKAWDADLRAAGEALPDRFEQFRREVLDFARKAAAAGIQRALERALERARKVNTPETFVNAQVALAGMDSLIDKEKGAMGRACDGTQPSFRIDLPGMSRSMADTLAQMLAGMCRRRGPAVRPGLPGPADGSGPGGGGESGFSMAGDPLLQAPVYGPDRVAFGGGGAPEGTARGNGTGGAPAAGVSPDATAAIEARATRTEARRQISLRDVPDRYRNAVRRFYGEDAVKETSTTTPKP